MGDFFDPDSFEPNQQQGHKLDNNLPPGEYLIALRWFERKRAQSGQSDYLRCRYEVIAGPAKGASFFANLSLNVEKAGAANRLFYFCKSAGVKGKIPLSDDAQLASFIMNRPFKAVISRKQNGRYVNNDIKRYEQDVDEAERKVMDQWFLDHEGDELKFGAGSGGGSHEPSDFDDSPPLADYGDDDIPF